MTSRSVEQDATVTFASALRRRSIGAVASISSNPLASRVRTVGAMIRKKYGKAYFLAFLELEDFLDSFLVVEEEDESEEELELLSDDLEESDESEDLDESESPEFSFLSPPPVFL